MGMLLRRHYASVEPSLDELKAMAKAKGIKGVSKLSKDELVAKLKEVDHA